MKLINDSDKIGVQVDIAVIAAMIGQMSRNKKCKPTLAMFASNLADYIEASNAQAIHLLNVAESYETGKENLW